MQRSTGFCDAQILKNINPLSPTISLLGKSTSTADPSERMYKHIRMSLAKLTIAEWNRKHNPVLVDLTEAELKHHLYAQLFEYKLGHYPFQYPNPAHPNEIILAYYRRLELLDCASVLVVNIFDRLLVPVADLDTFCRLWV